MSKILEIIGFGLIGGTIYSWIWMIDNPLRWPVFLSCAGGAFTIILYNRAIKKRQ
jgi:hypothetical protein